MTVKELIKQLQAFPQDAEITVDEEMNTRSTIKFVRFTGEFVIIEIDGARFI